MTDQSETNIGTITVGKTVDARVRLCRWHDRDYLDIRRFVTNDDGERVPTRKGVSLPVEHIDELRQLLDQAETAAREQGLLEN